MISELLKTNSLQLTFLFQYCFLPGRIINSVMLKETNIQDDPNLSCYETVAKLRNAPLTFIETYND